MKKLLITLTALLALTGCRSPQTPSSAMRPTIETIIRQNEIISSDRSGQTAGGAGQVADTGSTKAVEVLAKEIGDREFTFATATLSLKDEPNVSEINKTETEHKSALENLATAVPGTDPYTFALKTVERLGSKLVDLKKAQASRPKADEGSIHLTTLSTGEDHTLAPMAMASAFEGVLKSRHANQGTFTRNEDTSTTDITKPEEVKALTDLAAKRLELEMRKVELEKLREASSGKPAAPSPTNATPAKVEPVAGDGLSPEARANAWYPGKPRGGGNTGAVEASVGKRFLWKPTSESNGKAAIHTANHHYVTGIEVVGPDGAKIESHGVGSVANGWRPLFRLSKPGSGYPAGTQVKHLPSGFTITVPTPGKRFEKDGTPAFSPGGTSTNTPPAAPASTNAAYKVEGDFLTIPSDLIPHVIRVKVLHDDASNGKLHDAEPYRNAIHLGDGVYGVDDMRGAFAWFINAKPEYTGPVSERNAPGGWSNIVIDLPAGTLRPAKPGKG